MMKRQMLMAAALLMWCGTAAQGANKDAVTIIVHADDWGDAPVANIQALLENVQRNYFSPLVDPPPGVVHVHRGHDSPIILNRKTPQDPYQVYLNVNGTFWAQFSFQFSHELCHLACGSDRFHGVDDKPHPFMWFQESLCETASLFTLRRMADDWKKNPPYPNWTDFAPHLQEYAQQRIEEPQYRLPGGVRLADWYVTNQFILTYNPTLRPLNGVIAIRLLPLFEANPAGWQAVRTLPTTAGSLRDYLSDWLAHTPAKHGVIIRAIAREFQVSL